MANQVTTAQRDHLLELYVGYFNRAPEAAGINYWSEVLLAGINAGRTEAAVFTSIANDFYLAGVQYNIFSNAAPIDTFIKTIYANTLGRTTVDDQGMAYWSKALTAEPGSAGYVSRGQFVEVLLASAKSYVHTPGTEDVTWVKTYLTNRVEVAKLFATNSSNVSGVDAIQAGIDALKVVTPAAVQAGQTVAQAIAAATASVDAGRVLTLKEATTTETETIQVVVDGGQTVEFTVEELPPIVTNVTYWVDSTSNSDSEFDVGAPLTDLLSFVESYLHTNFRELGLYDINDSLLAISKITIAGAADNLQGEGVSGPGTVPGGSVVGSVGTAGGSVGGGSVGGGSLGVGGDISAGNNPVGTTTTGDLNSGYVEDTGVEGDYTGSYTISLTMSDGTINDAIVELTAAQFEFINGLLFDDQGNTRLEEREVTVYSYMPLLARDPETGALLKDASGNYIKQLDVNGKPIPVKAFDMVPHKVDNPDTVVDESVVARTGVLVPIVLTPTQNNGGTVETSNAVTTAGQKVVGAMTTAGNDTIVAGRLELLHQAYIDGGAGYNTLEVDAKGTYAQPLGLINIQEVHVENLPHAYTVPTGAGAGYLDNSSYPALVNLNVQTATGVAGALFMSDGATSDLDITITDLTVRVNGGQVAHIPAGEYTAVQLAEAINAVTGSSLASVATLGSVLVDTASDSDVNEVYFGGAQAGALGLSNIASDGTLEIDPAYSSSVLDLSRAASLERIVITEGSWGGDTALGLGELTVMGIRNGATARLEGGFSENVTLHYSEGRADDQPLTVELVLGEITNQAKISVVHNTDSLHLASLGGGSNSFDAGELGAGNLSQLYISGNAELNIQTDLYTSFHNNTPVTIDGSKNTAGVSIILSNSEKVNIVGSTGDDHFVIYTSSDDSVSSDYSASEYVKVTDTTGDNQYHIATYKANITVGAGNNTLDVTAANTVVIVAGDGNNVYTVDASDDVTITGGNGKSTVTVTDASELILTLGNGDSEINADNTDVATIVVGNGNLDLSATAEGDVTVTAGNGNSNFDLTSSSDDVVVTALVGNSNFTVNAADDATISAGNGNNVYTVNGADALVITAGTGNSEFFVKSSVTAVVTTTGGNNTFELDVEKSVSVTSGAGDDHVTINAAEVVVLGLGEGANWVSTDSDADVLSFTATVGNGDNTITVDADKFINITAGNGHNSFTADVSSETGVISITTGNGGNTVAASGASVTVTTGTGNDVVVADGRSINITTGAGNDSITVFGIDADYTDNDGALLVINTGTGTANINLGTTDGVADEGTTITAKQGSSITGDNVTLTVNTHADLRAADLTKATINKVVMDDDNFVSAGFSDAGVLSAPDDNAMLTLTDKQFLAIGAGKFGVDGAIFATHAFVKIIITETTSLTALGVDALAGNIDLFLELNDGVTLTMTAQQLHERVANVGVGLADDGVTDKLSGKLVITGAGSVTDPITGLKSTFDPFNNNDAEKTGYGDKTYVGGSLSSDFQKDTNGTSGFQSDDKWFNVSVVTKFNGFVRPMDVEARQVIVVDTTNPDERTIDTYQETWIDSLYIKGDHDLALAKGVSLNMGEYYVVDFTELKGKLTDFTLSDFQDAKAIYGNGANYDAVVNVKIMSDDAGEDAVAGSLDTVADALTIKGVDKIVVVDIDDNSDGALDEEAATIYLSEGTQDLETIALRGNFNATLHVKNVLSGVEFELQGDGFDHLASYPKTLGDAHFSNVGKLHVEFQYANEAAVVNINNQGKTITDAREIKVAGIDIDNASSLQINVSDGDLVIANLDIADDGSDDTAIESLDFTAVGDVTIENDLSLAALTEVDASGIAGDFTLTLVGATGEDATDNIDFTASMGVTTLTLDDVIADVHSSFLGAGTLNLVIEGSDGPSVTDLSLANTAGVDAVVLADSDSALTLTFSQLQAIGAMDVTVAEGQEGATLNLNGLTAASFPLPTFAEGVDVHTLTFASSTTPIVLPVGADLTGIEELVVPEGTTLVLSADQIEQLPADWVITGGGTVNVTDLNTDNADIDLGGISDDMQGTITLAANVDLESAADISGFTVELTSTQTLGLATYTQANGLDVEGGTVAFLFNQLAAGDSDGVDVSGYAVNKIKVLNVLIEDTNEFVLLNGLQSGVIVSKYADTDAIKGFEFVQDVEAGVSIPGWLVINDVSDSVEVTSFTLNLLGGTEIEGNLHLTTMPVSDAVTGADVTVMPKYLQTVVINSSGTEANYLSGKTANIIDGYISALSDDTSDTQASDDIDNNLLNVSIDASQELVIKGGIKFSALTNADYDDGFTSNDNTAAVAKLTVTGSADVNVGVLNTQDEDVDSLNVVNNSTGTLTLTLASDSIDSTDKLSFTGTGDIDVNIRGSVDLSNDTLTAVDTIHLLGESDSVTLTVNQVLTTIGGVSHITGTDDEGQTLLLTGFSDQALDSTLVGDGVDTIEVTFAKGEWTLNSSADLTDVDVVHITADTTVTMTADQALQLGGVDGVGAATFSDDDSPGAVINITGAGTDHFPATLDGDLEGVLTALAAVYDEGTLEIVENVTLTDDILNAASVSGFTLNGNGPHLRVDVVYNGSDSSDWVIGSDDENGVKSTGIESYIVTDSQFSDDVTFFVCNDTVGLKTLGLQGNQELTVTFDGIKRGVNFLLEGDGVKNWDQLEKEQEETDISAIGSIHASFFTELNPMPVVVDINNQGVELGFAHDGGERVLEVGSITIDNALTLIVNVSDGDATIASVMSNQAESLTFNAVEDLTITAALSDGLESIDATGVVGAFEASLNDMVNAFDLVTGNDATITLKGSFTPEDGSSITGGAGATDMLTLVVESDSDLSNIELTNVDAIVGTSDDSVITLTTDQAEDIGYADITFDGAAGNMTLNLVGLDSTQTLKASYLTTDVEFGTITMAAGDVTLSSDSDLTGVITILVPEGGKLTLTAAQYDAIVEAHGKIVGLEANGDEDGAMFELVITDLTQAIIDDGFSLANVSDDASSITIDLDDAATQVDLSETTNLGNSDRVHFVLEGQQTLGLASSTQADHLHVSGSDATVEFQFDTMDGTDASIDTDSYNVDTLRTLDTFYTDVSDSENAEFIIDNLPDAVTLEIVNDPEQLSIPGYSRKVVIGAGATVINDLVFNETQSPDERELLNLELTFASDGSIEQDLRIPSIHTDSEGARFFNTLTIHSLGGSDSENRIGGDITASASDGSPTGTTETENNLLNVVIKGDADLVIGGDIVFTSVNVASEPTSAKAIAKLTVDSSGDVTLQNVVTTDTDVDALTVTNSGSGTLSLVLEEGSISDDALKFLGDNIDLTIESDSTVDLSNDDISGVNHITLDGVATLVLTADQVVILGETNLLSDDDVGTIGNLEIVKFDPMDEFHASDINEGISVTSITLIAGGGVMNSDSTLDDVGSIEVPAGSTLTLTAAQFNQLADSEINAISGSFKLVITDLTSDDIVDGFDLSNVSGASSIVVDFADTATRINLETDTNLGSVGIVTFTLTAGQTLGLASVEQLGEVTPAWSDAATDSGLNVTGGSGTALDLLFELGLLFSDSVDASGIAVENLWVLNALINDHDVEMLQDLSSDVIVNITKNPDGAGPDDLRAIDRTVIVHADVLVNGDLIFNDIQSDSEVTDLTLTLNGDAEISGDLSLSTVAKNPDMVQNYFDTLTIKSLGSDADVNTIDGSITAAADDVSDSVANDLHTVVIHAEADLVVTGDLVFNNVDDNEDKFTLTVDGDSDVQIKHIDVSDDDIDALTISVGGTASLTVTGGSAALFDDQASDEGIETLTFTGSAGAEINLGSGEDEGIDLGVLSKIDANGFAGTLNLGVVADIDNHNFKVDSGTGVTTMTLTDGDLDAGGKWTLDFSDAHAGSELHLKLADETPGDPSGTSDSLTINLGTGTTLYIDADLDLTDVTLAITQNPNSPIVLASGVTLTLTAAQANELVIIGASDSEVNIVDLSDDAYDFSHIASNISGMITLVDNDVTVSDATDLGDFGITLYVVSQTDTSLAGQTIRFSTVDQAERLIDVTSDGAPSGYETPDTNNSTNVVWLFSDDLASPIETSKYDAMLGRVWFNEDLVTVNGGLIENLFTTLPDQILRVDFTDIGDLDKLLLDSNAVDRTLELVAFTNLGNLTFSDIGVAREEHLRTLTIDMGGEVTVGNITLGDVVADPTNYNEESAEFNGLTINSKWVNNDSHYLAPEGFINDGNPATVGGEHSLPDRVNTVGDIGVGTGLGLTNAYVDLKNVTLNAAEADLHVGTVTFDSEDASDDVYLFVTGSDDTTVLSLVATDPDINTLTITKTGTGSLAVTGASPANSLGSNPAVGNVEALYIVVSDGDITFGTAGVDSKPGIEGDNLSLIDISGTANISDDVNLGVIGLVDAKAFTLDANGSAAAVSAVLGDSDGMALADGGVWTFDNGSDGTLSLTLRDTVDLGVGTLTISGSDTTLTIDGDVDFTTLSALTVGEVVEIIVPTGSSLTILAEDADGLFITGDGVVNVTQLEDQLDADLSGIFTASDDTGDLNASLSTADGANRHSSDADVLPDTYTFTGELGIAVVTVTGGGTLIIGSDATLDATVGITVVETSFVVGTNTTLELLASDADDHSVTGVGTTHVLDIGAWAGTYDMSLADVASGRVNIDVDTDVTLNVSDDLGAAGSTRVTTIDQGNTLTAASSVLDGQYITGSDATLVVNDDNYDSESEITADLSHVSVEFITLSDDALVDPAQIVFPVLYGSDGDVNNVQTVTMTAAQADQVTIHGENSGADGAVVVNDLGSDATDLSNIHAGDLTAHVSCDDVTLDAATDLGEFDVEVDAVSGLFTLSAFQADGINITDGTSDALDADVIVTALDDAPAADLSGIDGVLSETALLDANGNVILSGNLGEDMVVLVTDSQPLSDTNNTVTFTGEMDSQSTTFELNSDSVTLVLDASDAHLLHVVDGASDTEVIVNNVDGDLMDLSDIDADTLTANVPADTTLHVSDDLGEFNVHLAQGADLTLTWDQFLDAGVSDTGLDAADFTSVTGGAEELITVTGYDASDALDTSVLSSTLALVLKVDVDNGPVQTVHAATNFTGVEEIEIPLGVTLNMTATQFQQIQHSVTVSGDGTLNITDLSDGNADIDLSSVTARAGSISLDADYGHTTLPYDYSDSPLVMDVGAVLDGSNASDSMFSIILTSDDQYITLSTETQADGREIIEISGGVSDSGVILGFESPDAADSDANIDASGYAVDNVLVLNSYLEQNFGGTVNVEDAITGLNGTSGGNIPITIVDTELFLDLNLISPQAATSVWRTLNVAPNTAVDANLLFDDIRADSDSEVRFLELNLQGNAVIDGNVLLPQTQDPRLALDGKYIKLFDTLTINSTNDSAGPLLRPNQINGNIVGGELLGGQESQVETFTLTLASDTEVFGNEEQFGFDGVVINLDDGDTLADVVADIAAKEYQNWVVIGTSDADGTVTFASVTAGAVTDVSDGDFEFTSNNPHSTLGVVSVTTDQQGVFHPSENNLLHVEIHADHALEINGVLEFRYVSGTESISGAPSTGNDLFSSDATLDVSGTSDVTIESIDTTDEHVTGLTINNNLTGGNLFYTGGSAAAEGGDRSSNTEFMHINNQASDAYTEFGSGVNAGIHGDELSLIDLSGGSQSEIHLGVIAGLDSQDFLMTGIAAGSPFGSTLPFLGELTFTLGEADVGTNDFRAPELASDGTWEFRFDSDADVTMIITSDTVLNDGGRLTIENVDHLILSDDVDLSGVILTLINTDLEIPAGGTLTIDCEVLEALIVADPTFQVVGGSDSHLVIVGATDGSDDHVHVFKHLNVPIIDMSGITTAHDTITLDLSSDAHMAFNIIGSDFSDSIITGGSDDTIYGGLGDDTLNGGGGSDDFTVDSGTDTVIGLATGDVLVVSSDASVIANAVSDFDATSDSSHTGTGTVTINLVDGVDAYVDLSDADGDVGYIINDGTGWDDIIGSDFSDTITVGLGEDYVDGGDANDLIIGAQGEDYDTILGGAGNDTLQVSADYYQDSDADLQSVEFVVIDGNSESVTVDLFGQGSDEAFHVTLSDMSDAVYLDVANDTVIGGDGADTINGGSGADSLTGGIGMDTFEFDSVAALAAAVLVDGGASDDTIEFTTYVTVSDADFTNVESVEILTLATSDNSVDLGAEASQAGLATVNGSDGADTIELTAAYTLSDSSLNGGDGNDTFIFASADQIAAVDGGGHTSSDSIEFSVNVDLSDDLAFADVTRVERLVLADGPNTVTLDAAASDAGIYIVMGNASDDVIELTIGYGSDSNLIGGAGDDTFMFAAVSQIATVDGGAHSDGDVIVLTVDGVTLSDADLTDVTNVEGLVTANGANTVTLGVDAQAAGIVSVTGGDGSDSIDLNGYTVNTFLFGGAGSDDIWGGLASDEITGGTGNDDIFGDEGDDTIFGADVGDTIDGGLGSDSLVLSDDYTSASDENLQDLEIVEVADSVTVGVTIDLSVQSSDEMFSIYGGISDDKITGGLGEDHIFAGDGNDTIYGLAGEDYVDGGSDTTGDTLVLTSAADDWNAWSVSDDQIVNIEVIDLSAHSDGADLDLSNQTEGFTIDGSASDDTIVGGSGADSIYGAGGSDDLTGGAGSDDLYGGLGDDMLTGGSDNDTFYVESGSDTITDLTTGDAFVVSASDATAVGLVDGVFETFEFLVDPYIPGGDGPKTFSFDGTDIQFSDGESMDSSSNLIAAASFANWTVEDLGLSVRFTAKAAGNVDVSISDFTYTDNRAPSTIKQFSNNTQGSGTSEFVATSSTTNAGTAYLYGGDEDDTLFDLSLAGGPNGYHLFGGSDSLLGADTLIGSNFDDVINGGNDIQLNSDAADVLVGGLGADQFVFNTFNSTPVDLSFSDSTAPFDEELISYSVSGETDEGTETLTIKWSLNGTPQTDVQIQAVGINVASALSVQTAIASKLNALSSVFAEVDGTVKVHGGDDLIGDLNAITIVEIQQTGGGWTTGAFSDENGTDIAQITDLTIGGGTLTTNEIYTLTGNLAANTSIGASYTVLDGDTSQDIAEGLATAFNIGHSDDVLAAAFSDAGVWHVSFTDQNADDGGFTLADVTSGAYGGSGASSNGAADIALADVIMDFSDAEGDTISFGLGIAVSDDFQAALTPATDYADALADAGLAMNSVLKYYFTADSTDGYLFFDANQDGLVDGVVKLAGVTDLNSVHYTDII